MTSTETSIPPATINVAPVAAPPPATGVAWGNSAPLALAGFATTTFMLSMIYANLVPAATLPVVFGVALMFGWIALVLAALAFYLALAEVCEASYGREVLPVGHLAKK